MGNNPTQSSAGPLESASEQTWTEDRRDARRAKLLASRHRNLEVLEAYRERGRFPQNNGKHARHTPIFVDSSNTACAVGYLMRQSGAGSVVDSIKKSNNHVYISEATNGPLIEWILTSGFTKEEAALIQPGYPFIPETKSLSAIDDGREHVWSARLDPSLAFQFVAITEAVGENPAREIDRETLDALAFASDWARDNVFDVPAVRIRSGATFYSVLGSPSWSRRDSSWMESQAATIGERPDLSQTVEFIVITHNPKRWIEGITLHSGFETENVLPLGRENGRIHVTASLYNEGDVKLGELALDTNDEEQTIDFRGDMTLQAWRNVYFDPVTTVRIIATIDLWGTARFNALAFGIDAVRKPHSSIQKALTSPNALINFTVRSKQNVLYELHQAETLGEGSTVVDTKMGNGRTLSLVYYDARKPFGAVRPNKRQAFYWLTTTPK